MRITELWIGADAVLEAALSVSFDLTDNESVIRRFATSLTTWSLPIRQPFL